MENNENRYYHPKTTFEEIKKIGDSKMKKGETFKIDVNNKFAIESLVKYYIGDSTFEDIDDSFSLNKGIALIGNRGVGKTSLFKIFNFFNLENTDGNVHKKTEVANLMSNYKEYGEEAIVDIKKPIIDENKNIIYLDNFGIEKELTPPDQSTVMAEVMLARYDIFIENDVKTHLSTNIPLEKIEKYYGQDVFSRFKEMFNIIVLKGESRR